MNAQNTDARAALKPEEFTALAAELGLGTIHIKETSESTNTELANLAQSGEAGDRSVYFTEFQQHGKGRLGRTWLTPQCSALTVSVLALPGKSMPTESLSWYTMLAALAWCQAVGEHTTVAARIKWPNDVLAGDKKICGILAQLVGTPQGFGVVVGTGMNVDQDRSEIPVDTATSLKLANGAAVSRAALLGSYLRHFTALDIAFREVSGDAAAALVNYGSQSLSQLVSTQLATLNVDVRVEFPDGSQLEGVAKTLESDGALLVRDAAGTEHRVLAGDVHHVRRADGKYA
ncbi:biotin--[acetyl-CoA-carboxylase] ligase [Glutamicibacter sp.]|uniref:biotin--[acetyl-CoA-carboxylase] ligase n=1 Tax=Glutamicibacter sp. TaxID=1931995 RepID=UPI0028BF1977|nr:biotin--[acetyl-CoA-carboxylase] ligase [Glutamicibacter sp.]